MWVIDGEVSKLVHHLVVVLFHFLLEVIWRRVLSSRLVEPLTGLPGKVRTFRRHLSRELLIVHGSLILSGSESCVEGLCRLWGFEEILFRPWGLDIHSVLIVSKHVIVLIMKWWLLLLCHEVIGSTGRVISLDVSLFNIMFTISFGWWKDFWVSVVVRSVVRTGSFHRRLCCGTGDLGMLRWIYCDRRCTYCQTIARFLRSHSYSLTL